MVIQVFPYLTNLYFSGKVFVREWAKFRYGVFEEYGYPGDDRYPMFYYNRYDHLVPNYCSDVPLEGYSMQVLLFKTITFINEYKS